MIRLPAILFTLWCTSASAVLLDKTNFEKEIEGKSVFLKFFAPYCGHCKDMAPAWEKLQAEWENKYPHALVAEIDCTTMENENWCQDIGIKGFPTLRYGDGSMNGIFLEDYHGDRDYETLSRFAEEELSKPVCSPGNMNVCDAETRKKLESYWKMSVLQLEREIQRKEERIALAEQDFVESFSKMQKKYDESALNVELVSAQTKRNIRMINSVIEAKK